MYTKRFWKWLAAAMVAVVALAPAAGAEGRASVRSMKGGSSVRSGGGASRSLGAAAGRVSRGNGGGSVSRSLGSRGGSGGGAPRSGGNTARLGDGTVLNELRGAARDKGSGYPLLDAWRNGDLENYRHGYGYGWRDDDDEFADAYRDAAIAQAVVGVVGALAQASVQRQAIAAYGAQPVAYTPAPAYAPAPAACPPAPCAPPAGYYRTEQVMVSQGYYEDVRVWVPEVRDPRTGAAGGGYYELRKRWVAPVYEYRPVWVAE